MLAFLYTEWLNMLTIFPTNLFKIYTLRVIKTYNEVIVA